MKIKRSVLSVLRWNLLRITVTL